MTQSREEQHAQAVERGTAFIRMYEGGATLRDIGKLAGVSAERIRQLIVVAQKAGVPLEMRRRGRRKSDASEIMRILRASDCTNFTHLYKVCGYSALDTLVELGAFPAVSRLFRARQSQKARIAQKASLDKLLANLRVLVDEEGYPVSSHTLQREHPGVFGSVWKHFRSIRDARIAAGFTEDMLTKKKEWSLI